MVRVKICGMMRMADIEAVNEYKPEYAGFIFAPSRRRLNVELACELCAALDKDILRVGVFVNEKQQVMSHVKQQCGLDILQIYQDNYAEQIVADGLVWRAIRVKDARGLSLIDESPADAYLLDAYSEKAYGGVGETFDWALAAKAAERAKIVLAGGLTPDNVQEAVRTVMPFAVDVSSGVETDGRKDADKIRQFIERARSI
ncbi:MAG: phosphoribosylanthranilate isomerase [Clostridia bacterium]|jgi:phosphoribosylanthranilate isomerase|nr:phosphoribosylanthranilate isomerase [Clostridia bacterium]